MAHDSCVASDSPRCWICRDGGQELVAPCKCSGSMKWVHRKCLARWRRTARNPRNFTHCRHCDFRFRFPMKLQAAPRAWSAEEREQQCQLILRETLARLLRAAVVLAALLLLAMLIRLADQDERLVLAFGFRPPPGQADFVDALGGRVCIYLMASALLSLFLMSVSVAALGCVGARGSCLADPVARGDLTGSSCPDADPMHDTSGGSHDPFLWLPV